METNNILELKGVSKFFGSVIALSNVDFQLKPGEIHCLLGDNGAGKSTLIKILAGVHKPSKGIFKFENKEIELNSPRNALDRGIATVYQDLALVPLMSVTRNFFMGREPLKKIGPLTMFDLDYAKEQVEEKLAEVGIKIRSADQAVGTMSGGERQCLAIARAIYFGAKVLILDEPTAALGVKQSGIVLKMVAKTALKGVSVILITHNVHHAYPIGDSFTLLNRGKSLGTFSKKDATKEEVLDMMAGGQELKELDHELAQIGISA